MLVKKYEGVYFLKYTLKGNPGALSLYYLAVRLKQLQNKVNLSTSQHIIFQLHVGE